MPRSLLGWWYEIKPRAFLDRHALEPDRYCSDCAKAARLALAAESAPKPSDAGWPKPRPISEAPKDKRILAWEIFLSKGLGWIVVSWDDYEARWVDSSGVFCNVTHFLPLPPEVK